MDGILRYIARHGRKDLIRHKANFDWHRELIVELRRRLPLGWLGVRTLFSFYCMRKGMSQAPDRLVGLLLDMYALTPSFHHSFEAVESCT
jgi:hypothetical protein